MEFGADSMVLEQRLPADLSPQAISSLAVAGMGFAPHGFGEFRWPPC